MGFCRIVPVYSYSVFSIHSFFAHAKLCIHYCVQCKNYNFLFLWFRIVLNLTSECETINFNWIMATIRIFFDFRVFISVKEKKYFSLFLLLKKDEFLIPFGVVVPIDTCIFHSCSSNPWSYQWWWGWFEWKKFFSCCRHHRLFLCCCRCRCRCCCLMESYQVKAKDKIFVCLFSGYIHR